MNNGFLSKSLQTAHLDSSTQPEGWAWKGEVGLDLNPSIWPSELCGCNGSCRILSYLCLYSRMGEPNPTLSVLWL